MTTTTTKTLLEMLNPELLNPQKRDTRYDGSPMMHVKNMGPGQKGSTCEKMVEDLYTKMGSVVEKPTSSEHDRIIDGIKTEIKGSCLAANSDVFSFLQIRPSQDYSQLIFFMAYPNEVVMMKMNKETVMKCVENKHFKPQHGGKKGNSGTYLYYGNPTTLLELGAEKINV
tara:strand:+ start:728 stop:1237 length:510 start_codon:yes stop_codon:yes gene_type:complete